MNKNIAERLADEQINLLVTGDTDYIAFAIDSKKLREWIEKQPEMNYPEKQDSWISIDDKLPEPDTYINFYSVLDGVVCGEMTIDPDDESISFWTDEKCINFSNVTHWMPLPEKPKN